MDSGKPAPGNPLRHLRASDLRGATKITTDAAAGVTRIVEGVHQSVLQRIGLSGGETAGRTRGLTGLVYRCVHDGILLVGKGIDTVLAGLEPVLESLDRARPGTPEREAFIAILNGIIGDRLAEEESPFATPMTLRFCGEELSGESAARVLAAGAGDGDRPAAGPRIVLLVHGLCMNDLGWRTMCDGIVFDHGEAIATALGFTPVYLRYNSGRHISENGKDLARLLEDLIAYWPVEVEDLTVVAHSMGGLVIRSAVHMAAEHHLDWTRSLRRMIFLGTPHHGAPLERVGNWIDVLLGSTSHTLPFAGIGQLRSAGITDLRYGNLVEDDWHGRSRFLPGPDSRRHIPLPGGVECFAVAATRTTKPSSRADRLIGDGLVPVESALGQHREARRNLELPEASQLIAAGHNHLELLSSREVSRKIIEWIR